MKIAIIGGGWVGCHLALKLKEKNDVVIYEKNNNLFEETSLKNQNRLHIGYHYSRNSKTRNLCFNTFDRFIKDYSFLTEKLPKNLYCVPRNESIIDYDTFKQIFNNYNICEIEHSLSNIEGCVNTDERFINFELAKKFFNENLSNLVIKDTITKIKIKEIQKNFDLVINCTNNQIKNKTLDNSFYELTLTLIYEKVQPILFDALTLVDGKLFSIYPYINNTYTLTDVKYTPIKKFNSIEKLNMFIKNFDENIVTEKKRLIENKVNIYYTDFSSDFKYKTYFLSIKSKIKNLSDDRSPIITRNKNLIHCFTGKIQGIYLIEDYLKKEFNL